MFGITEFYDIRIYSLIVKNSIIYQQVYYIIIQSLYN